MKITLTERANNFLARPNNLMGIAKKTKKVSEPESVNEADDIEVKPIVSEELEVSEDEVSTDNFSSSDDSDDELLLNRSGSVPAHWYESEDHRGYDVFGRKVAKTLMSSKIDELLKNAEDPNRWRTVQDVQNEREVYLTDADIEIIRRLRAGHYPDGKMGDEGYFLEFDDAPHKLHPVRHKDLPKSRFLASKDETKEIRRLVKLIRAGKLVPGAIRSKRPEGVLCDLWAQTDEDERRVRGPSHLPAPKMPLPGHAESYRPPEEFLFSEQEKSDWLAGDESTRVSTFVPESFPSLRRVPWYTAFITERFSRCLDLYTVPRMLKKKMNVSPESLIPKLPQVTDLRPFPSSLSVEFIGHSGPVAAVSIANEWLASVCAESVRVWDILSGKCVAEKPVAGGSAVAWHPTLPILAVGDVDGQVHFVVIDKLVTSEDVEARVAEFLEVPAEVPGKWELVKAEGFRVLNFGFGAVTPITSLAWHHKGTFMAVVSSQAPQREHSCCVVSVVTKKHVSPLKGKGQAVGGARHVIFHPHKPYLVVAGNANIAIFDLKSQTRVSTLNSNSDSVSSVAIHPAGDGSHVIATALDGKVIWFDSEVRNKPWKNFRQHTGAVRKVSIHSKAGSSLPLMASAGDDKSVHVLYAKVYTDDASKNPLVVPVKKLNHPAAVKDCQWHPALPWLFTACDDGTVRLWA